MSADRDIAPPLRQVFLIVLGLSISSLVTACNPGPQPAAMAIPLMANDITVDTLPIKGAISVGTVTGGHEGSLPSTHVSNENLRVALNESLGRTGLKGPPDAPYVLTVQVVDIDRPLMGVDMTVTGTLHYDLFSSGQSAPIWSQTIVKPYTAQFLEDTDATRRLVLAEEGAMRENIQQLLERLIADARPGGPLGGRPGKT